MCYILKTFWFSSFVDAFRHQHMVSLTHSEKMADCIYYQFQCSGFLVPYDCC